jgi:hypothetical protein
VAVRGGSGERFDGGEAGAAAVRGGSGERLRREEEMDAAGEGGETRDLGGAGGSEMGGDDVEDGRLCGVKARDG